MTDKQRLDWLQDQIVDTIYLDDGTIIDVRGGFVREAIDRAMGKTEPPAVESSATHTGDR